MAQKKVVPPDLTVGELAAPRRTSRGRRPANQRHAFYQLGDAYAATDGWTVIVATVPLFFTITPEMIAKAAVRSARFCVVAQALDALFGTMYSFQVGSGETKIWDFAAKIEVRFHTPSVLARAISGFDRNKGWQLPPNLYRLAPMNKKVIVRRKTYRQTKVALKQSVSPIRRKARKYSKVMRTVIRNTRVNWSLGAA